jgi:hypothetical protein
MNLDLTALEAKHGLPTGLLNAVMQAESGGNPKAVSPAGAQGLFQFMPATANELGIDPFDPQQAAEGAAKYYGQLSQKYKGDIPSMLAAYNWGMGNVDRQGLDKAPAETRGYIEKVTGLLGGAAQDTLAGGAGEDGLTPEAALAELARRGIAVDAPQAASPVAPESKITPEEALAELQRRGIGIEPESPQLMESETALPQTIAEQYGQSLLGLGDEITDPIVAGIGSLATDVPYETFLKATRERTQQRLATQQEKHPVASALSQIAGGVMLAGSTGGALKQLAPSVAAKGASFAQANPYITSSGLGALSGALYGAGTGEGDLSERGSSAFRGGVAGALAGPVGTFIGRNIIEHVARRGASALEQLSKYFDDAAEQGSRSVVKQGMAQANNALQVADDFAPDLARNKGDLFSKTGGQRSQNPALQRLENDARAGTLTTMSEKSIRALDSRQNQEYRAYIDKLAGGKLDDGQDINGLVEKVGGVISQKADALKQQVNSAYDVARASGGVKIGTDDIRQGLWKQIADNRREGAFDLSQMPKAKAVIKRLASYSGGKQGNITAVKLGELENWRKMASNAAFDARGTSEGKFLGDMIRQYDGFMERTAESAVDAGDSAAINAFKDAVSKRREFGQLFEKNKLVSQIVGGEKSVDDTVRALMGSGSIKGKAEMANNLDAILKASGDQADAVRSDLQQAFMNRVFGKADIGYEAGSDTVKRLSPAKLKTEFENLFVHQSDFARKLFGENAVKSAQQAIKELDLISSTHSNTRNASGSGEWLGRFLNAPLVNRIPGTGIVNTALEQQKKLVGGSQVERGLKDVLDEIAPPKSAIWTIAPATGATAAAVGNIDQPKPAKTRIVITPED